MVASPRLWFRRLMWSYGMKIWRKLHFSSSCNAYFIFKKAILHKKLLFCQNLSLTNNLLLHFVHRAHLFRNFKTCDYSQIRFRGNTGNPRIPPSPTTTMTNSAELSFFSRTFPLYRSSSLKSVPWNEWGPQQVSWTRKYFFRIWIRAFVILNDWSGSERLIKYILRGDF